MTGAAQEAGAPCMGPACSAVLRPPHRLPTHALLLPLTLPRQATAKLEGLQARLATNLLRRREELVAAAEEGSPAGEAGLLRPGLGATRSELSLADAEGK